MKISVIIPFKNDYLQLKESLLSLARQNFLDWQLLAVDMGSVDGSRALVKSFGPERDCLLVNKPDKQKFAAINEGLREASGDYIYILEPGDRFLVADGLSQIATASKGLTLVLLSYELSSSGEQGRFDKSKLFLGQSYLLAEEFPLCALFWTKSFLFEAGGFDETYLLCAQKLLLAHAFKALTIKDVALLDEALVVRDAGNFAYIFECGPILASENRRAIRRQAADFKG